MLPVAEAQARLIARLHSRPPLPVEEVALTEGAGRTLAEDLAARLTQPPADVSAMDGWAVRGADLAGLPVRLASIAAIAAGHPVDTPLTPGTCARIFTGAPLPPGADTVVLQEDSERLPDGSVQLNAGTSGRHVRRRGLDFAAGEPVLKAGRVLSARDIGLAAAAGHVWLPVRRRPRVGILATGDEIRRPGDAVGPGQIISANSYTLAALVREAGGEPSLLGVALDRDEDVQRLVANARGCDLLLTSGGASVGEHDRVQAALTALGMELDFWKIAMRPGKPLMVGDLHGMPLIGLPGNPVSAFVCATLFLRPALAALLARTEIYPAHTAVRLGSDLPANDQRQDYLRSRLTRAADGGLEITPFRPQDSSMMRMLAEADALLVRPPFDPARKAGDMGQALLLG